MAITRDEMTEIVGMVVAANRASADNWMGNVKSIWPIIIGIGGAVLAWGQLNEKVENMSGQITTVSAQVQRIDTNFNAFQLSGDRWTAQDQTRYQQEQERIIVALERRIEKLEGYTK